MKNMRLQDYKNRHDKWYRKLGKIDRSFGNRKTIEYIVRRSYEALPKKWKKYLNEKDAQFSIDRLVDIVSLDYDTEFKHVNATTPYKALLEQAKGRKRQSGDSTKEFIYKLFRTRRPTIYAKYNSYMYRAGYSAVNYFMENAELIKDQSKIEAVLSLPSSNKLVSYSVLLIQLDRSGVKSDDWNEIYAEMY